MKKPARPKTAARSFPDKEFEATTTRITIAGRITGRLYYSPLKDRANPLICILKMSLALYMSCIEILGRSARERKDSGCVVFGIREWHFNRLSYLLIYGRPFSHCSHGRLCSHRLTKKIREDPSIMFRSTKFIRNCIF